VSYPTANGGTSIVGTITMDPGASVLNLAGFTGANGVSITGNLTQNAGTLTPPNLFRFIAGSGTQNITTSTQLKNVSVLSSGTFKLLAPLSLSGNFTFGSGTYSANGQSLTFNGGGAQGFQDVTGLQDFGDLIVSSNTTIVTLSSSISIETLNVN